LFSESLGLTLDWFLSYNPIRIEITIEGVERTLSLTMSAPNNTDDNGYKDQNNSATYCSANNGTCM
jgi:hypothetical protein